MLKSKSQTEIQITGAKGRPMLSWVGKRPLDFLEAFPAQTVETFGTLDTKSDGWDEWPAAYPHGGLLLHGDNKECLAHLLHAGFRGQVKLIYIDPPFDSGADYVRKVQLRGLKGQATVEGQQYSLGEQIQYTDIWANDNYLQFMFERLLLLKELLSEGGSLYLHCDSKRSHFLRCCCEEVFGPDNFRGDIIWKRTSAHSDAALYGFVHDTILFFSKGDVETWNNPLTKYEDWYVERYYRYKSEDGRQFKSGDLSAYGLSGGGYNYVWKGREGLWRCPESTMQRLDNQQKLYYTENGVPRLKQYLDESEGMPVQSIWDDIQPVVSWSEQKNSYPTQKSEALLERIISASSKPGDIVLDAFLGSGTTAAVAQKLGRRWIGCDINKGAIQTASKRLQNIITTQKNLNGRIVEDGTPAPSQLGFVVARVNDYDLNVQHLEAVELACLRAGVTRTRSDAFFDGTLGDKLVKVVPFQHPLSPADIAAVKEELKSRPDETRSIVMVTLGVESAALVSLAEWNQYAVAARRDEKGQAIDYINKIEALDLREGGFFVHQDALARLSIERIQSAKGPRAKIEIQDFVSPTILTRLNADSNLFKARADGWKSCVDCILVDLNHANEIFNVSYSDIPAKKDALVLGSYELEIGAAPTTVAVKIIDLLGEEVVVTQNI